MSVIYGSLPGGGVTLRILRDDGVTYAGVTRNSGVNLNLVLAAATGLSASEQLRATFTPSPLTHSPREPYLQGPRWGVYLFPASIHAYILRDDGSHISYQAPQNEFLVAKAAAALNATAGLSASEQAVILNFAGGSLGIPTPAPAGFRFFGTGIRQATKVQSYTPPSSAFNVNSFTMSSGNAAPTNIRLYFPTFYNTTTGSAVHEIDTTAVITLSGLSVQVNGGAWQAITSPGFPIVVDPAVNPSGLWLPEIMENIFPANAKLVFRVSFSQAAPAGSPSSWTLPLPETTGVDSSRSATTDLSAYLTNGQSLNGSGVVYKPVAAMAKGTDGLPVPLIIGDSIGVGVNGSANAAWWSARQEYGYLGLGLDDNTTSKRISFLNLCVAGQGIWSDGTNIQRKLAILTSATAINNGPPCDEIFSEHGTNSVNGTITLAQMLTAYRGMYTTFRTALSSPTMPVTQLEMLAKPQSTDNYQTLINQTAVSGNDYPGGVRWQANAAIASLFSGDGSIQYSYAPWVGSSYDTGSNRDKLKLLAYRATSTASFAGSGSLQLSVAPAVGDEMTVFDTISSAGWDIIITSVSGTGPFTVTYVPQGGSGTVPAATSLAVATIQGSGLHPSPNTHLNFLAPTTIAYKQSRGWV